MPFAVGTSPGDLVVHAHLGSGAYIDAERMPVSTPQQAALDAQAAVNTAALATKITRVGLATENPIGNAGLTRTVTWATAQRQAVMLDQNTTLTFDWTGAPVGNYLLKLTQDGSGGRTATWSTGTPGTTRWLGVVGAPALNSVASGVSFASIYYDGTQAWGRLGRVGTL